MLTALRFRFWFQSALAVVLGALMVLTMFVPAWIEAVTGVDPDHGSGSVERLLVATLAVSCTLLALAVRGEWHRSRAVAAAST